MGVVGGAEAAGPTRTKGPVGGSGRDVGSGDADAGGGGAGAGDSFLGPGVNTDSNGTSTVGSSGDSGAFGTQGAWPTGAWPTGAWPAGAVDGGGLGGKGGRCGRLQAEKGGSGSV